MPSLLSLAFLLLAITSSAILEIFVLTAAVDTPWILGDEASVACYTLDTREDIPKPVGLEMHWTTPPPTPLDSTRLNSVQYWARVQENFWNHSTNRALLGAEYDKYFRLCLNETTGCDQVTGECCIWHSNVHSCRAESGACEPWVAPQNTSSVGGPAYTLVTHTASQVGGMGRWDHEIQLDEGDWVIIAHVRIMTFQCAVGATRVSLAPPVSAAALSATTKGIIATVSCLVVILIVAATLFLRTRAQATVRDTSDAPQEPGSEVTLLFTDIQDSTNLWSNYTASMAYSLDVHHDVIRRCIKKHHGYEVKTAGDAFMIAVKSAEDGLKVAQAIQVEMMKQKFPRCITQHYLLAGGDPDSAGLSPPPCSDDPDDLTSADPSSSVYHGLRIRIGLHTGYPDIQWDEVSKGFDYYGPHVNLAARVEAAATGGQILISEAAMNALTTTNTNSSSTPSGSCVVGGLKIVPQGQIIPKGLNEPHNVYTAAHHSHGSPSSSGEEFSMPFPKMQYRDFPKLIVGSGEEDKTTNKSESPRSASLRQLHNHSYSNNQPTTALHQQQQMIIDRIVEQFDGEIPSSVVSNLVEDRVSFLKTLLKPLPKAKARSVLENLCNGWRINNVTTLHGDGDRDLEELSIISLCGRIIPAESNKLRRSSISTVVKEFNRNKNSFSLRSGRSSSPAHSLLFKPLNEGGAKCLILRTPPPPPPLRYPGGPIAITAAEGSEGASPLDHPGQEQEKRSAFE